MTHDAFLQACVDAIGAAYVLTAPEDQAPYLTDWRKRFTGRARAVLRPADALQVAALVRLCGEHAVPMVPQGGNTGLCGGATPDMEGNAVVISVQRMQRVRAVDPINNTITVDAGCILANVQQAAAAADRLFPLSLAAEGSCTIGGNLATNAGGTQVVRYGNARELCLGLEVVLADGQVWEGLQGLRKDNTGYDLRNLFIGSEGTLGIITAATLRLYPQPAAQLTAWAAVPSLEAATALLALSHRHLSSALTGFEVMNQEGLKLVDEHYPHLRVPMWRDTMWCVLLEASDSESEAHARAQFEHLLETAMEDDIVTDAIIAENLRQAHDLWHIRESITLAQAAEGLNIKHDVSVPISCIPEFVAQTDAQLQALAPGVRLINFGHLGDGNLHYNMQAPAGADAAAFIAAHEATISDAVYQAVHRFGGSISAEHGIGALKRDKLPHYKTPVALQLMRTIKQALDPQCLLNPGRVLAAEPTQ